MLLEKRIYTELDKTAKQWVQDATSAMNKEIGRICSGQALPQKSKIILGSGQYRER